MRIHTSKRMAAAAVTLAVAASVGFAVSAQGAVVDHDVRQSDFIPDLSDTRSTGEYEFLKEGLHVETTDAANPGSSQNKVAEYFDIGTTFPTEGSSDWYGTSPQPGAQLVFDFDQTTGNGNDYNILVGEPAYNGDWWLTGGSSADAKAADPSGAEDGGSGSAYFGTLEEWKAAMPNAKVLAGGFSLGSGVKGDGVLRSITYGEDRYVFTDAEPVTEPPAPTVVNPAGTVYKSVYNKRTVLIQMKTAAIPAGSVAGSLPTFKVVASDSTVTTQTPAPGTSSYYSNTCAKKTTCTYKVYKNNSLVTTVTIKK